MALMPSLEDIAYGAGLANVDPASLGGALRSAGLAALRQPDRLGRSLVELALTEGRVGMNTLGRLAGGKPEPVSTPPAGDRRFDDRAWKENALLAGLVDAYLSCAFWAQDLVDGSDLDEDTRRKARFALGMMIDALAPSNTPWLNPEVSREAIDTKGLSLLRGARNFVHDVRHNGGRPSQVDTERFTVGVNLAATPGRVVLRNQLIELIAYEPQTPKVHAEPILCCPPWINKYYIMDLAPGRSFVEYAVQHGFTVFMISYRDPDESLSELTMDDYLRLGILSALDRVEKLTGAPRVNLVALCLGGTLALIALAYLAACGESKRVGWATLTNTLADFSEAGDLRVFTDEKSVAHLERTMRKKGYLEASRMAGTFDWLRGNDLVWNYVVSNWYMGKKPPAFDILAWNGDGTRMPAVMHSQYLRACYLDNLLVKPGAFSIAGETVDLGAIKNPLYVLSAEADHIAPWRAAYRTTQLVGGEARFTLTSSGHIAGIVNPPGNPKASHWVQEGCPPDPEDWRKGATRVGGSWWEDWLPWAKRRSGALISPPTLPQGEPAPGLHVRGQTGPLVPGEGGDGTRKPKKPKPKRATAGRARTRARVRPAARP
jgi:polyhydroxyalkanoate synthase subunit PhaC